MSIPIKYCFLVEAADNKDTFAQLHPMMKRNLDGGHFSIFACEHDHPCRTLSNDEMQDLLKRFREPPNQE